MIFPSCAPVRALLAIEVVSRAAPSLDLDQGARNRARVLLLTKGDVAMGPSSFGRYEANFAVLSLAAAVMGGLCVMRAVSAAAFERALPHPSAARTALR